MKGIVLAGGKGTRLFPLTSPISKQLLPIFDKPMILYPISVLMLAGIKDILLICAPHELERFKNLLGNGNHLGINIQYRTQAQANGIAEAFIIGEDFIGSDGVTLILGDNFFHGSGLVDSLRKAAAQTTGATVFTYAVKNPSDYGIVELDGSGIPTAIHEKPDPAPSNLAVTGLYFYDNQVVEVAKSLKPSARGELEITDINAWYLEQQQLRIAPLGRGTTWLDTGSHDDLLDASNYVATVERRQGLKIACLEEIAFRNNWISAQGLIKCIDNMPKCGYREYLASLVEHIR